MAVSIQDLKITIVEDIKANRNFETDMCRLIATLIHEERGELNENS